MRAHIPLPCCIFFVVIDRTNTEAEPFLRAPLSQWDGQVLARRVPILAVVVPSLPRNATVELEVGGVAGGQREAGMGCRLLPAHLYDNACGFAGTVWPSFPLTEHVLCSLYHRQNDFALS